MQGTVEQVGGRVIAHDVQAALCIWLRLLVTDLYFTAGSFTDMNDVPAAGLRMAVTLICQPSPWITPVSLTWPPIQRRSTFRAATLDDPPTVADTTGCPSITRARISLSKESWRDLGSCRRRLLLELPWRSSRRG